MLRALADEVGVAEKVIWTGRLAHEPLRALLALASVVAVTSRYEPFGLVARQAQGAGAAVVVTDVGGLADAVEHDITGLRVAPGDVDDLAVQLGRLLGEPRRAAVLGEAGRAVRARLDPRRHGRGHHRPLPGADPPLLAAPRASLTQPTRSGR